MLQILPEPPVWKAVLGFDFDDTLVLKDHPEPIEKTFFDSVRWTREQYGAAWGIATGRSLYQLIEGFNAAQFPFLPDFVIAREREIYFPGQFGRWVPHEKWNTACERDHKKLFRRSRRSLAKTQRFVEEQTDARWVSIEGDAAGIEATSDAEMSEIQRFIEKTRHHKDLSFERNSIYLRFSHRNYNKGSGLLEAADRWGISPPQILAVGDNFNDLSMLHPEVCEASGCPANALPEVRDYVSSRGGIVAKSPGSLGVTQILKHYFDK